MPFHRDSTLFHHQIRVGLGGKAISVTKVRTMRKGAEKQKVQIKGEKLGFEKRNLPDPRTIPLVGELLRKTHLDELPQLDNVRKGELLLIGMRTLPRTEYQDLPPDIKKIYQQTAAAIDISYAIKKRKPSTEEYFAECRKFFEEWRKDPEKTRLKYLRRFAVNYFRGRT